MQKSLNLFWSFFKVGVFTFGGGYAMVPLIEKEVVDRRAWIDREEFLDLLTLAQTSPGPLALNTAVFVGYKIDRYRGAFSSVLGVVVPSFVIILLVALFFVSFEHEPVVEAVFKGMRPAVVALILVALSRFRKPPKAVGKRDEQLGICPRGSGHGVSYWPLWRWARRGISDSRPSI